MVLSASLGLQVDLASCRLPCEPPDFAEPDQVFTGQGARSPEEDNPALTNEDVVEMRASRYRHAQPICDPGYLDRLPP